MSRRLVSSNIESLKPYEPGKPIEELERELGIRGSIKLASNENPLGPSPLALDAMRGVLDQVHFYPDAGTFRLRDAVARHHNVDPAEVLVGNGSNEVLTLLARTFCVPGDNAVVSQYSFIAYRLILQAAGIETRVVETGARFEQDLPAIAAACDENTRLVFLANPNNPTGTHSERKALTDFLRAVPEHVIVVLDEAYVEYAQSEDYVSALELREHRERLVVCRTFSKIYGLAGVRVGYAITSPELVGYVNRVREPFNVNLLAQAAGVAALEDHEHLRRSVEANEEGRAILEAALRRLGWDFIESQTNFLLVRGPKSGKEVYDALLRDGVIVRPLGGYGLGDWVRITIGTPAQVERLVASMSRL